MRIHNVRLGFATNSSSMHSIVILRPGYKTSDLTSDRGNRLSEYQFGWETFRLVNSEEKSRYVIAQFVSNLKENLSYHEVATTIFSLFGVAISEEDYGDSKWPDISVDHQSVLGVGASTDQELEFWADFYKFVQRDNVVIIGGNDNDGAPDSEYVGAPADAFELYDSLRDQDAKSLRMRKDGNVWVLFNAQTGAKVRVSFTDDTPYAKASTPELVDLKITDYCPYGCKFCYQNSTKEGIHSPKETIFKIIRQLAQLNVFEIAIGGGEPTMHPDFAEILKYANKHKIVPNFTTYSTAWLSKPELTKVVADYAGGIGVSVHNSKDLEKVKKIQRTLLHTKSNSNRTRVMAQHVIGTCSVVETIELIEACSNQYIPILLLGYKSIGLGKNIIPTDFTDFPLIFKLTLQNQNRWRSVSVDTAILNQFPDLLKLLEVNPVLATFEEGKFSCYIDGVTSQMGPSSYAPNDMAKLPKSANTIKKLFATY